jgi:homogentisate 1,2-dioxygenase
MRCRFEPAAPCANTDAPHTQEQTMIDYHSLGELPPKHHITFRTNGQLLMEQCVTRKGFEAAYSILYFKVPPTDESAVDSMTVPGFCPVRPVAEQPLHRRHIKTQDLPDEGDFLTGRRTVLLNSDVQIGICKPREPARDFFSNADGDECWFAHEGGGVLESLYGRLPFRKWDYILVPKGTPYRLHPEGGRGTFLIFEGRQYIDIPKQFRNERGQLTMDAPYCHRDFRRPDQLLRYDASAHGKPPFRHVIKKNDQLTVHVTAQWHWDLMGWDGCSYPAAFNILDYQPKTGLVHLPPTIHITFAGNDFVICSFVPRIVDYYDRDGAKAIPCPYGHASVDCDEILYYVDGNFTSRRGIQPESISLHPAGIPHGPHPGTYRASIGSARTSELAVMCDTFKPLYLTEVAAAIEDKGYHTTWVETETPIHQ